MFENVRRSRRLNRATRLLAKILELTREEQDARLLRAMMELNDALAGC